MSDEPLEAERDRLWTRYGEIVEFATQAGAGDPGPVALHMVVLEERALALRTARERFLAASVKPAKTELDIRSPDEMRIYKNWKSMVGELTGIDENEKFNELTRKMRVKSSVGEIAAHLTDRSTPAASEPQDSPPSSEPGRRNLLLRLRSLILRR